MAQSGLGLSGTYPALNPNPDPNLNSYGNPNPNPNPDLRRVPRDAVVAGGRTEEKQDTRGAGALQALPWLSIKLQARYRRATAADLAQYKITGALQARYSR